jgi:hypothetical protein
LPVSPGLGYGAGVAAVLPFLGHGRRELIRSRGMEGLVVVPLQTTVW